MELSAFFATVASNFRTKYVELAQQYQRPKEETTPQPTEQQVVPEEPVKNEVPVDEYVPETTATPKDTTTTETKTPTATDSAAKDDDTTPVDDDTEQTVTTPATDSPVELKPDGTYYYQRAAKLQYKLDLQFDLTTITQTIERLADGDTTAVDSFAAAGFGLHAGFDIGGWERVTTNVDDATAGDSMSKALTRAGSKAAGAMSYRDDNFRMDSFYREASRVKSMLKESTQGAYKTAVSKFSARYRLDNRFSMSFAERFNAQTERVATDLPDDVANYVGSAGNVAAGGTTEMMNSFFDAVDAYLDGSEQKLLDNVTAFFDQTAAALGFEGETVDALRTSLTDSITSFFDAVDTAVSQLGQNYVPEIDATTTSPTLVTPEVTPTVTEPAVNPDLVMLDALDDTAAQPSLVEQLLEATA